MVYVEMGRQYKVLDKNNVFPIWRRRLCEGKLSTKNMCVSLCRAFNGRPQSLILFHRKEPLKSFHSFIGLFMYSTNILLSAYYKPGAWDKTQSSLSSIHTGGGRD